MKDKHSGDVVERELELIRELREASDLKATLARAEAQAEWDALERRFGVVQQELERLGHHPGGPGAELETTSATLQEIRRGYERLRRH